MPIFQPRLCTAAIVVLHSVLLDCTAGGESLDPDVAQFRADVALAVARDDFIELHSLAIDTDPDVGSDLLQEWQSFQSTVAASKSTAFSNQRQRHEGNAFGLVRLVEAGRSAGVEAGVVDSAAAQALSLAQMEVERRLTTDADDEDLRESLQIAVRAGAASDQSQITTARTKLRLSASVKLQEAVSVGEVGRLTAAINLAKAEGVVSSELGPATQQRNELVRTALATAVASGNLIARYDALRVAEEANDDYLVDEANAARTSLVSSANETLNKHAEDGSVDFEHLEGAVHVAGLIGLRDAPGFASAHIVVAQRHRRNAAREAVVAALARLDWWDIIDAVQHARDAQIEESYLSGAVAAVSGEARNLLAEWLASGKVQVGDAEEAWRLATAAGLPDDEIKEVTQFLKAHAKAKLLESVNSGKIVDVVAALGNLHLAAGDLADGKNSLRERVVSWIPQGIVDDEGVLGRLRVLNHIVPFASALGTPVLEQAVQSFRDGVFVELASAADARSLDRLNHVLQAVSYGARFLTYELHPNADGEVDLDDEAAAEAKIAELQTLKIRASEVRLQEEWKFDASQNLQEAMNSLGVSDLEQHVAFAEKVGLPSEKLDPYRKEIMARRTVLEAARKALSDAVTSGDKLQLSTAIRQAKEVGLAADESKQVDAAMQKLSEIEKTAPPQPEFDPAVDFGFAGSGGGAASGQ